MKLQVIHVHREAPVKPAIGATCNGCGVCCAAQPCPAGMLVFRRRRGTCPALRWSPEAQHYRCGLLTAPGDYLRWLPKWSQSWASRLFRRWIAAGIGCDSDASPVEPR